MDLYSIFDFAKVIYVYTKMLYKDIFQAIQENNLELFKTLFEYFVRHKRINIRNESGESLLHVAVMKDNILVTQLLIENGSDVNARDQNGITPLHLTNKLEIAKLLLENGANVKALSNTKYNANKWCNHQEYAIFWKSIDIVKLFLDNGADVDAKCNCGTTTLHLAARNPYNGIELAKILLDKGADVDNRNNKGETALHLHVKYSADIDMTKLLVDSGADVNAEDFDGNKILHNLASSSNEEPNGEVLKYLLENGAGIDEINEEGATPLQVAIASIGNFHIAIQLIENGANVNVIDKFGRTALHNVLKRSEYCGSITLILIRALIKKGADINAKSHTGWTPLHEATYYGSRGDLEIFEVLFEYGCDVNAKDNKGFTPLHIAAQDNRLKSIHYMYSGSSSEEDTEILTAAALDGVKVMNYLLEQGGDINSKTIYGCTPLHWSVYDGHIEMTIVLLERKADVNFQTYDKGYAPLHLAASKGKFKLVEILMNKGANPYKKTFLNKTASLLANINGHKEIMEYLMAKMIEMEKSKPKRILSMDSNDECKICCQPILSLYCLYPCGHGSICISCCEKFIMQQKCPFCRQKVDDYIEVY